jgi:hypothetical protein
MTKAKAKKRVRKAAPAPAPFVEPETALVIRTVAADLVSRGDNHPDFKWPELGPVEAPDWTTEAKCGHGLHGQIWGEGDWSLLSKDASAKWQVVEVRRADLVELFHEHAGKVKFARGDVKYTGNQAIAMAMVLCGKAAFDRTMAQAKADDEKRGADAGHAAAAGYAGHAAAAGDAGHAAAAG